MKRRWFKLDNVAKIFPPSSSKRDPKVFRFTCVLKDDINKDILQEALMQASKKCFWLKNWGKFPVYKASNKLVNEIN